MSDDYLYDKNGKEIYTRIKPKDDGVGVMVFWIFLLLFVGGIVVILIHYQWEIWSRFPSSLGELRFLNKIVTTVFYFYFYLPIEYFISLPIKLLNIIWITNGASLGLKILNFTLKLLLTYSFSTIYLTIAAFLQDILREFYKIIKRDKFKFKPTFPLYEFFDCFLTFPFFPIILLIKKAFFPIGLVLLLLPLDWLIKILF